MNIIYYYLVCQTYSGSNYERSDHFELIPHGYWPSGVIYSPDPDQYNCVWKIIYQQG